MFPSISKSIIRFLLKLLTSWNGLASTLRRSSTLDLRIFLTTGSKGYLSPTSTGISAASSTIMFTALLTTSICSYALA